MDLLTQSLHPAGFLGREQGESSEVFDHDVLLALATCETLARRSPEIQDLFEKAETHDYSLIEFGIDSWISLTHVLQRQLVLRGIKFIDDLQTASASTSSVVSTSFFVSPAELREAILEDICMAKTTSSSSSSLSLSPSLSSSSPSLISADSNSLVIRKALKAEDIRGGRTRFERGLTQLRLGGKEHPDTIGQVSIYWKHNRANQGILKESDPAPDVPLHNLDGSETSLHELARKAYPKPLIVVGGSYS
jgi:hypothetical protein